MAEDVSERKGGGLKTVDIAIVVIVGIVGVIVAFWLLDHILGILWFIVKLVLVVAVVGGLLALLFRRRR